MNIETLNCPNCGAGVASDHTQCEFCRTRLKTIGCPKCLGLVFFGTRFCGHCGSELKAAMPHEGANAGNCPRCVNKLEHLDIAEINLCECQLCGGMWSDAATFEGICADSEKQAAVLGYIGEKPAAFESKVSYVPCPSCGQRMNRSNFARSSGVIIDICRQHGVWFDKGELTKIIDFIRRGGMEIARQKERMAIEEERARLRDEIFSQNLSASRFDLDEGSRRDERFGIRNFVKMLFDA